MRLVMNIKTKIFASFLILILVILVLGISNIYSVNKLEKANIEQNLRMEQILLAKDFAKKTEDIILTAMDIIIDKEEGKIDSERTDTLTSTFAWLKQKGPELVNAADTPAEKEAANYVFNSIKKLEPVIMNDLTNAVVNNRGAEAFAKLDNDIDDAAGEMENKIAAMIKSVQSEVDETSAAMNAIVSKTKTFNLVLLIAAVLLGLIMAVLTLKSVLGPIKKLTFIAKDLAEGEGDLTKRVNIDTNDEIEVLSNYIDTFINNVHNVVAQIVHDSNTLTSSSGELAATTEELSATFNEQAMQVSEVASAMEEMSASSQEVLGSVEVVISKSADTNEKTGVGKNMLNQAVGEIEDIKSKISGLSDIIVQLADSSQQIGDILNVIDDIADQTNLLALNAAIEAARAGDQGRGFAVVADEVRKLAERTQNATGEVEGIISSLQNETANATSNMNEAIKSVEQGVQVIMDTNHVFDEIVSSIQEINSNNDLVGAAIQEESRTILSVNDNVQMIASAVEQSSRSVAEVASTVVHLQELSEKQNDMVEKFKV